MSGEMSGVQNQIRDRHPNAVYTHCAGHSLNLVIVSSCSAPPVQNCIVQIVFDSVDQIFSKARRTSEGSLSAWCSTSTCAPILNVCITCWVENIDGWELFFLSHPFLVQLHV